ncbi:PLP-dependent aminotransferase family protein [Rhodanobacter aciditrophus]|uniref:PLP-dependent aminotransferase family protein n=1 Tax=Rhodanobacter aciditrophus TaxID=1623218 RepID=A0ABW4AX12_9GAMM
MDQTLYQKVADQIETHIQEGLFKLGERIPSVRKASAQMEVSMATVLQAYRLLEDRGVIKAQPQKGYFVHSIPTQPLKVRPQSTADQDESIQTMLANVLRLSQDTNVTQFGAAIPNNQFLPIRQLQRSVGRLMRLEPDICAAYAFTPGSEVLRRQIAIRMLDTGCKLSPEDILITLGCQHALMLALQSTTMPGDTIAIESPSYHGILQAAKALHLKVIEIPCHWDTGLDLSMLANALAEHPIKACVVSPENQNPTGAQMPQPARHELLTLAANYDITIIEDDVYGELCYQSPRLPSLKALDRQDKVIYCGSFSKSIAPGFRVGWIIGGKQQAAIAQQAYVQSFATPTLTQVAIANFLENGAYDRHLRKTRQTYQQNLSYFQGAITKHFPVGTHYSAPKGGFILWVTLPKEINALALHKLALQHKIGLLPGHALSHSGTFTHHIRINYALPWNNHTETALKTLGRLCFELMD